MKKLYKINGVESVEDLNKIKSALGEIKIIENFYINFEQKTLTYNVDEIKTLSAYVSVKNKIKELDSNFDIVEIKVTEIAKDSEKVVENQPNFAKNEEKIENIETKSVKDNQLYKRAEMLTNQKNVSETSQPTLNKNTTNLGVESNRNFESKLQKIVEQNRPKIVE